MTVDEVRTDNTVQLNVHGKVDANSSTEFQNAVLKGFQKGNHVVINFADLQDISSAGLRALVIGQKTASSKGGKFTLINVNPVVMDILHATGFDKILTIQ